MKKSLAVSLLAATMALGAAPMATFAHGGDPGASQRMPQHASMHRGHGVTSGKMFHSGKTFHRLKLSDAQREQMFQIRHGQAPEMFKLRNSQRATAAKLRELSGAVTFDEAQAQSLAQELGQIQGRLALLRAQARAQTLAVLTPEQREQLAQSREQRRAKHAKAQASTRS